MKKIFLSIAMIVAVFSTSFAQDTSDAIKKIDRVASISKELNLTAEQQEQMNALNQDFRNKMKGLREDSSLSKEARAEKRKQLSAQHKENINQLLTPEQQVKFTEKDKKRNQRFDKKRMDMNLRSMDGKKVEGYKKFSDSGFDKLDLTPDQKEKIKALNEEFKDKKGKEYATQRKSRLNEILTPEQQESLKESRVIRQRDFKKIRPSANGTIKFDSEKREKLKELENSYQQEKKSIEMSRIAPEEQKQRLDNLRDKYRKDRRELIKTMKSPDSRKKAS